MPRYKPEEKIKDFPDNRFPRGLHDYSTLQQTILIVSILASCLYGGCEAYKPMPITAEAIDSRLKPPDMAELRILASEIKHPILKPIDLKPDDGISPDSAAVLAVLLNPSLQALRDQKKLSSAQLIDAGLLPNPELTYNFGEPTGGNTAGAVSAYGLELSWDVTPLLSRSSKIGEAKAAREAVNLDIGWQEWQVAQAARVAVYQLASLKTRISLAEQICQHTAENLANIRKAFTAESLTVEALNVVQTENNLANENLLNLRKETDQQLLQLKRLLGLSTNAQIRLKEDIDLPSRIDLPADMTLLNGLEQRRLDLLALRRGYDSQEAAVRAAILEQFPKVSIGPAISRDADNIRTTGFSLSIELPIFNRNQGKIARELATRQKLFDEYVNRVAEARSDIKIILSGMKYMSDQIAAAWAAEIDFQRLEENYRSALVDGRTDALTYNTAWRNLVNAQMKISELKAQLMQALTALQLESGFYEIPNPAKPEAMQ
jgi:outer membrane protein, heavy metal efflux system